jgi:hypothetical protein
MLNKGVSAVTDQVVEGFSLTHAAILDGSTGAEEVDGDIYGVRSGTIAVDTGNYDNTGDDSVLSSWFWFNFATVTVQSGYLPFTTIALLAGSTITSSGAGVTDYYSLPLYEETSLNQPPRPMLIRVPAKDKDGVIRTLDFVLYRVQFGPFSFDGPSYKSGLLLSYTGRAVMSDKDETGTALPRRAIGRLVNRPGIY